VRARFISEPTDERAFIPARLDDNPHLDREAYLRSLAELDPLTRAQLLAGDWNAIAGGRFKPAWFKLRWRMHGTYLDVGCAGQRLYEPAKLLRFGTCDPAASATNASDYTVVSAWAVTPQMELVWLDCHRGRWEIPDQVPEIQKVYDRWGLSYVAVEACASNRGVYQLARRTRMAVKEVSPDGKDKLTRATKSLVLAESGRLVLPQHAPWVDDALAELTRFTGDERVDAHDDIVDTVAYAGRLMTGQEDLRNTGFAPRVMGGNR
jgi:predicted phage terminase large subunit-like protein